MHSVGERLMVEFTENYMEKVFYFCLRKTGSEADAQDLTQEIALHILSALHSGKIPEHFSAWVWQIVKNRYAAWANAKHLSRESVTGADISDYEIEDESENLFVKTVEQEQLALLRRELAFIKSEYRNIVVAYYMQNRSIRDIALANSLSCEAVKKRLQRARKILKEGMDMAREFGVRSYRPEKIAYSFNVSKPGANNQPYSINWYAHRMYQNIALEAYGNPSTAEALALELGVALPYMEDELEYLTRETFLIKQDGKYQTAMPIISAAAQLKVHAAQLSAAPEITKALIDFTEYLNKALTEQEYAYYGNYADYESAKWSLLMLAYDSFLYHAPRVHPNFTERPEGGFWDMVGYELCSEVNKPCFVGNHGSGYGFQQFRYEFDGICDQTPPYISEEQASVLRGYVTGEIPADSDKIAEQLAEYGYLREENGAYVPTVMALDLEEIKKQVKALDSKTLDALQELADAARMKLKALYCSIAEIVKADLPAVFADNTHQINTAVECCYFARGYIMQQALLLEYLQPAGKVSKTIGAHLYV
ncbi:MAG: sigma-70 family RNA polymerase sigma factor [Clostridia bacterium]|nr:sigma-70 family RNA polymerase sigma factor [Clostridia bacterium]